MKPCPFCDVTVLNIVKENKFAIAIYDQYPVNEGHMLIIPKRHVASYFEITLDERNAMHEMLEDCKLLLDAERIPDGYNIGINCGKAAGQTVFRVHMHLIPRFLGDIDNPRGGVRRVIPEKRIY